MSYPSLSLCSDPNNFAGLSHESVKDAPFNGGSYAVRCNTCFGGEEYTSSMFWRLGQRRPCCFDPRFLPNNATTVYKCASNCPAPNFPGNLTVSSGFTKPVDDLTGYYCGYARNARYVGNLGGVTDIAHRWSDSLRN